MIGDNYFCWSELLPLGYYPINDNYVGFTSSPRPTATRMHINVPFFFAANAAYVSDIHDVGLPNNLPPINIGSMISYRWRGFN